MGADDCRRLETLRRKGEDAPETAVEMLGNAALF